jgi:hypothetical protein
MIFPGFGRRHLIITVFHWLGQFDAWCLEIVGLSWKKGQSASSLVRTLDLLIIEPLPQKLSRCTWAAAAAYSADRKPELLTQLKLPIQSGYIDDTEVRTYVNYVVWWGFHRAWNLRKIQPGKTLLEKAQECKLAFLFVTFLLFIYYYRLFDNAVWSSRLLLVWQADNSAIFIFGPGHL